MSKTKKSKSGVKPGKAVTASEQGATCDGCCTPIEDNEHEAIQCEGSCQKWYHRLCAGVSKYYYDKLADSPNPFICWLCSDSLQKAVIHELQQELAALKQEFTAKLDANHSAMAALKEENAALKVALGQNSSQQQSPAGSGSEWSRVLPRRRRKPQQRYQPSPAEQSSSQPRGAMPESRARQSISWRNRTQVSGASKIWGTHSSATTRAVSKTIATLTKVSDSNYTIKRKFKLSYVPSSARSKVTHWWFVIRGDEEILGQLEDKWNLLQMQVDWKLEPLYSFVDATCNTTIQQPDNSTPLSPPVTESSQAGASSAPPANDRKCNPPVPSTTQSNPANTSSTSSAPHVNAPFLGEASPAPPPVQ
jgi:hypothetical protein